jgi:hypothetical protein
MDHLRLRKSENGAGVEAVIECDWLVSECVECEGNGTCYSVLCPAEAGRGAFITAALFFYCARGFLS